MRSSLGMTFVTYLGARKGAFNQCGRCLLSAKAASALCWCRPPPIPKMYSCIIRRPVLMESRPFARPVSNKLGRAVLDKTM